MADRREGTRRRVRGVAVAWSVYLLLLIAHHVYAHFQSGLPELRPHDIRVELRAVRGDVRTSKPVQLSYQDSDPGAPSGRPVVVMLHGSPGSADDFTALRAHLPSAYRILVVDLPGFGRSQHGVPDYSIRAHADYVRQLFERLGLARAHVVGFSMGGGVALELQRMAPTRVASITMLSAIGVQEFELLGSYQANHALHVAQLWGVWFLQHAVPHFGALDDFVLGEPYARNFYDTDQRPLRAILESLDIPMLVVHAEDDFLVPVEAAREHLRIVPHAQSMIEAEGSHFLLWTEPKKIAARMALFVDDVEAGRAPTRIDATPERLAAAAIPLEEVRNLRVTGLTRALLLFLISVGTFVSEDVVSVGTGLLIAHGRVGWWEGLGAVFVGIYFGDLLLYAFGRLLGITVIRWIPFRWMIDADDLRRAARWFEKRGFWAIMLSRFVPGSRMPVYVAAGVVRAGFWRFAGFFLVAVLMWTPVLVGFSTWVGQEALDRLEQWQRESIWIFVALIVVVLATIRIVVPMLTWRGRRLMRSRWIRIRRWEYWPSWLVYLPLLPRVLGFARHYGSLMLPTAANPGMPLSGVVGESKSMILAQLGAEDPRVASFVALPQSLRPSERREMLEAFLSTRGLSLPIVIKPDAGQRGEGVVVVRDEARLTELLELPVDLIAQEFVPGEEFGIFYAREHEDARGRIISLCEKQPLVIVGDGRHSIENLILRDARSLPLADRHLRRHFDQLDRIPLEGEPFVVSELGTHSLGATFFDAGDAITDALEEAIDDLSRRFDGFRFGRYDVRVPSRGHLERGEGIRVLELNGITSECVHMYDPSHRLGDAQAILRRQWELAYRIGAQERDRGAHVGTMTEIIREWWRHARRRRHHASDRITPATSLASE